MSKRDYENSIMRNQRTRKFGRGLRAAFAAIKGRRCDFGAWSGSPKTLRHGGLKPAKGFAKNWNNTGVVFGIIEGYVVGHLFRDQKCLITGEDSLFVGLIADNYGRFWRKFRKMLGKFWRKFAKILMIFSPNFEGISRKFWRNFPKILKIFGLISKKFWANFRK